MKKQIIFLASAEAMKPAILINSFYECIDRNVFCGVLLTNNSEGRSCDLARRKDMTIIVSEDTRFADSGWIKNTLGKYGEGILVSCGWPYKIPIELINVFTAAVNCHGSYLPDYRGSRSYMHYWANCSKYYGATIHYLNEKWDDGNVILRAKLQQFPDETHDQIFIRTAELCGHLLPGAISLIEQGHKGYRPDDEARYFFKRTPEEFEIHRQENEKRISKGLEPLITAHKIL